MPLHLKTMAQELAPLAEGKSNQLRFNEPMHRSEFSQLVDAIRTLPSLKTLELQQSNLQEMDVERLAGALAERNDLTEFSIHKTALTDDSAEKLSAALKNHPQLEKINISYCGLNDKGVQAFAEVIAQSPHFRHLTASGNHWNQETQDKLALTLSDKPALASLDLWRLSNTTRLDEQALEKSLLQNPHPNLVTVTGISSPAIDELAGRNLAARSKALHFLKALGEVNGDYTAMAHPNVLEPQMDSGGRMQGWNVVKDFNLMDGIFEAQSRRSAIIDYKKNALPLQPLDALLEKMPTIPADEAVTIEKLFTEDKQGIAPVENPRTWQNHPNLLNELAEQDALTHETYAHQTSRGNTLLESALRNLPTSSVVAQLTPQGMKLGKEALLDEDGKPNKILDIIFSKGELGQLFSYGNWVGKSSYEVRSFTDALPTEMQSNIPPLNTLFQQLGSARSTAHRGR